jgi:hypothetical protein
MTDKLTDLEREMWVALKDIEGKLLDYHAGMINFRLDDFLLRVREARVKAEAKANG